MMIDDYDLSDWNNNHDLTLSTGESVNPPQFFVLQFDKFWFAQFNLNNSTFYFDIFYEKHQLSPRYQKTIKTNII
jgi:hypothetical protein